MVSFFTLQEAVVAKSFDADATAAPVAGTSFAVPAHRAGNARTFAWRTSFASAPSAVSIELQGSFDDTNWFIVDTSTATAGEKRKVADEHLKFVRIRKASQTGGGALTAEILI